MKKIKQLEQELNVQFQQQENITELRRFHSNTAYCCDAQGAIIGLCICENELENLEIPAAWSSLQYLNLSDNKRLHTLEFESSMPNLWHLDVSDSVLKELIMPNNCTNLKWLDLSRNALERLSFNGELKALEYLDVSGNELVDLTIPSCPSLKYLYALKNQLNHFWVAPNSKSLEVLHLENNQLTDLPENCLQLSRLHTLYLYGNPLNIPETLLPNEAGYNAYEDIRNYLKSISKHKKRPLHEAKMILVGNGEVGKTSIRLKLLDRNAQLPSKTDRTQGLDIVTYPVKQIEPNITGLDKSIDFQLNIWDFGGQGKYREIQQLFCSRKSLYLFVTAHDDNPEKEHYIGSEYWLSMVKAHSYDRHTERPSPVIYVVNKIDEKEHLIDEKRCKTQFENLRKFIKISCINLSNFDILEQVIRANLPHIHKAVFTDAYANNWLDVKSDLEQLESEQHITYKRYLTICRNRDMDESAAKTWLSTLDRIGTVIHFGDNPALKDWIILNPIWMKTALCEVLESELVQNGRLAPNLFAHIWNTYDAEEQDKLLALMEAYELCYKQISPYSKEEKYIIPARLNTEAAQLPKHLSEMPLVQLKFEYTPFLPAGTVNKLMVRLHPCIFQQIAWKNNVLFFQGETNTYAHVWEVWEEQSVYLNFWGSNIKSLYAEINISLQELNASLKATKYMHQLEANCFAWDRENWEKASTLQKYQAGKWEFLNLETNKIKSKEPNNLMKELHNLVGKNRLEEAIQLLMGKAPTSTLTDEVIQLQQKLTALQREERLGTRSFSEVNVERARITSAILDLGNNIENTPKTSEEIVPTTITPSVEGKIYFSYAWGSNEAGENREALVDGLYDSLLGDRFDVKRDKIDLAYGDSITAFMEKLGKSDLIAVFISDKYMKSPNCMFELYEIARNNKFEASAFANRILPVFVEYIDFNAPQNLIKYLKHWKTKEEEWATLFQGEYASAMSPEQYGKYDNVKKIHQNFTQLAGWLSNINASTSQLLSENDFAIINDTILKRLA